MVGSKFGGYALAAAALLASSPVRGDDYKEMVRKTLDNGRELISGGTELGNLDDWPWMIALNLVNNTSGEAITYCGASMISPIAAVTAAHCSSSPAPKDFGYDDPADPGTVWGEWLPLASLYIGRYDLSTNEGIEIPICQTEGTPGEPIPAECGEDEACLIRDPDFDGRAFDRSRPYLNRDFAIIIMPRMITEVTEFATLNQNTNRPDRSIGIPVGEREVTAAGWGITAESYPDFVDVASEATFPPVSPGTCQTNYQTGGFSATISADTQICAGDTTGPQPFAGTCFVDSGGPLVTGGGGAQNSNLLVGITSWGDPAPCGTKRVPSVYARVSEGYEWMCRTICDKTNNGASDTTGTTAKACDCEVTTTDSPTKSPTKSSPPPSTPPPTTPPPVTPNPTTPPPTTPNPTTPKPTTPSPVTPKPTPPPTPTHKPTWKPTWKARSSTSKSSKSSKSTKSTKSTKSSKSSHSRDDGGWWGGGRPMYPTHSPTKYHHDDGWWPGSGGHSSSSSKSGKSTKSSKSSSSSHDGWWGSDWPTYSPTEHGGWGRKK